LPNAGRLIFTGNAGQLEINTADEKLRRDYSAAFSERLLRLQSASRTHSIPLLTISAAEDVLEQVKQQLGYHAARGRR
jgi:hypothetical protein